MAVTLAAVVLGAYVAMRESINDTVDRELRSRLVAMRAFLAQVSSNQHVSEDELATHAAHAPAGARFRVANASGQWIYQSPGTEGWGTLPVDILRRRNSISFDTMTKDGERVRVLSAAVPTGAVQIGIPVGEFAEMLRSFAWTALLAAPFVLFASSAAGYWMSRRAMRPVERIAHVAEDIEAHNLSERLPLSGASDELDHLSATLNAMLARLEDSFLRMMQFTADASHELRTPVAIIRTTAEVTRRKPRSEMEYTQALDRILAESERTTELIEDLLSVARADANADPPVREPVELAELAQAVASDARMLAKTADITLTSDTARQCMVAGDKRALRRLLLILLDNAIKYSKPGGEVKVLLTTGRRDERPVIFIDVMDNGIGISPEDLPYVFERFYRASKDGFRRISGAGLGLAIARSIARQHDGEIEIASEPGKGSIARVLLPAA
jgi:heavy metal sensor kinase